MRDLLVAGFGFSPANISYLTDSAATKNEILKSFFRFAKDDVVWMTEVFIFFEGHGHTLTGSRGEIGYLVPYDANISDYSTLIRWDDLTRTSVLIRSKHVLVAMDACYGRMALTRNAQPGSTRFLNQLESAVDQRKIVFEEKAAAALELGVIDQAIYDLVVKVYSYGTLSTCTLSSVETSHAK